MITVGDVFSFKLFLDKYVKDVIMPWLLKWEFTDWKLKGLKLIWPLAGCLGETYEIPIWNGNTLLLNVELNVLIFALHWSKHALHISAIFSYFLWHILHVQLSHPLLLLKFQQPYNYSLPDRSFNSSQTWACYCWLWGSMLLDLVHQLFLNVP